MNHSEKIAFVQSLCDAVAADVIKKLPHVPDDWDGHELREFVADEFWRYRILSRRAMYAVDQDMRRDAKRRLREYRNAARCLP